jgi:hypothetical protein
MRPKNPVPPRTKISRGREARGTAASSLPTPGIAIDAAPRVNTSRRVVIAISSPRDRSTRMPPAGERPDNLSLAADAENSTVFGEQHRVTRALA